MENKQFFISEQQPAQPIYFEEEKCIGCKRCVEACQIDLLVPNTNGGKVPEVIYSDECWYCGCCVMECPTKAIHLKHPLMNQAKWVLKKDLLENNI